jgi:hypothetical protein
MRVRRIFTISAIVLMSILAVDASAAKKSKKAVKKKKGKVEMVADTAAVDTTRKEKKDKYKEAIKDAKVYDGLIKAYMTPKNELLFEFTPENFKHMYLLTNRLYFLAIFVSAPINQVINQHNIYADFQNVLPHSTTYQSDLCSTILYPRQKVIHTHICLFQTPVQEAF